MLPSTTQKILWSLWHQHWLLLLRWEAHCKDSMAPLGPSWGGILSTLFVFIHQCFYYNISLFLVLFFWTIVDSKIIIPSTKNQKRRNKAHQQKGSFWYSIGLEKSQCSFLLVQPMFWDLSNMKELGGVCFFGFLLKTI